MMPGWVPGEDESGPLVEIDGCIKCGATFFDAGELESIASKRIVDFYASDPEAADRCWKCGTVVAKAGPFVRPGPKTCPSCGSRTARRCPACSGYMGVVAHGDVLIDVCPDCKGIFLDGGEYDRILAAPGDPLKCVSCEDVVADSRRAYFSDDGVLCPSCREKQAPAPQSAGAGEGQTPVDVPRGDISRFIGEYLRQRGKITPKT